MISIKNQLISVRTGQKALPSVHADSFRLKSNIGSNEPRKFQTFLLHSLVNSVILQAQHNWRQMQNTKFVNFSKLDRTLYFRSKCVRRVFGSRKWNNERPTWLPLFETGTVQETTAHSVNTNTLAEIVPFPVEPLRRLRVNRGILARKG
jgi:hypothetical protein